MELANKCQHSAQVAVMPRSACIMRGHLTVLYFVAIKGKCAKLSYLFRLEAFWNTASPRQRRSPASKPSPRRDF